jgi:mercuric ion binding protein
MLCGLVSEETMKNWRIVGIVGALALGGGVFAEQMSAPAHAAAATENVTKTALLHVEGMTCAACPVTVRMVLRKLAGVQDASVNRNEKRAVVQYDPAKVTPQQMADAVTKAGYKSTVVPE